VAVQIFLRFHGNLSGDFFLDSFAVYEYFQIVVSHLALINLTD
jgi:hypothetical protein